MSTFVALVPGVPVPQGRGRIVTIRGHGAIKDPQRSKDWKAAARLAYVLAMRSYGYRMPLYLKDTPVYLHLQAVFPRPLADKPGPAYPHAKGHGDLDNILKAVQDAGKGVLWYDDCQVCAVYASKWVAARDCQPYVRVYTLADGAEFPAPRDWPAGASAWVTPPDVGTPSAKGGGR